jgi:hypothetical protein
MSETQTSPPPTTVDRSDAIVMTMQPAGGPARRVTFEPRDRGGYRRVERVWSGCGYWRHVGSEVVDYLSIDERSDQPSHDTDRSGGVE